MQAESAMEQMDWVEKITGVITCLLSSQTPEKVSNDQLTTVILLFNLAMLLSFSTLNTCYSLLLVQLANAVPSEVPQIMI